MDTRSLAVRWIRPEQILTPDERADDLVLHLFLDLAVDIVTRLSERSFEDPTNPSPLTWVMARGVVSDMWKVYRESSDARVVHELMSGGSYQAGRQSVFRDLDQRSRIRGTLLDNVQHQFKVLQELSRGGRVVAFPKKKEA